MDVRLASFISFKQYFPNVSYVVRTAIYETIPRMTSKTNFNPYDFFQCLKSAFCSDKPPSMSITQR